MTQEVQINGTALRNHMKDLLLLNTVSQKDKKAVDRLQLPKYRMKIKFNIVIPYTPMSPSDISCCAISLGAIFGDIITHQSYILIEYSAQCSR